MWLIYIDLTQIFFGSSKTCQAISIEIDSFLTRCSGYTATNRHDDLPPPTTVTSGLSALSALFNALQPFP
jgi:hypothetical protein